MPTGLFRATHPHNPTLYSHIGVGHIIEMVYTVKKYSLQGTTQSRYLTGGVPPVRFSM